MRGLRSFICSTFMLAHPPSGTASRNARVRRRARDAWTSVTDRSRTRFRRQLGFPQPSLRIFALVWLSYSARPISFSVIKCKSYRRTWPNGLARNRANLKRFIGYPFDQGLFPERVLE